MRTVAATLVAAAGLLALPSIVLAGDPGAVEQYSLDIPSADGNEHPAGAGAGTAPPPGATTGSSTEAADGATDDGRPNGNKGASARKTDSGPPDIAADTSGDGPVSAVAGELGSGSDSGTGPLLPIVLGLSLVGALAVLVARRRGGEG